MKKIFIALIIIFVIILILASGLFVLTIFSGKTCTMVGCLEGVTIITNKKFSNDISVLADDEVLLDLCQFNEMERTKRLDSLYLLSDRLGKPKPEIRVIKENPHKVDVWQIFIQPNCVGQKQLLYEIEDNDVNIMKTEPNGPGCGTCQNGIIDLSS
tara:strand:+ start:236 stop:703 length:468 start_codon:yes stop_codon:yes gene_type:complete